MTLVMAVRSSPVRWSSSASTHLGRTCIYCRTACRKAAYEQRRAKKPGAAHVEVCERVVVETRRGHLITDYADRVPDSQQEVEYVSTTSPLWPASTIGPGTHAGAGCYARREPEHRHRRPRATHAQPCAVWKSVTYPP